MRTYTSPSGNVRTVASTGSPSSRARSRSATTSPPGTASTSGATMGIDDLMTHFPGSRGRCTVAIAFGVGTIAMSVFAVRGVWWGSLAAGIVQTLNTIMTMSLTGAAIGAKEKIRIHAIIEDQEIVD